MYTKNQHSFYVKYIDSGWIQSHKNWSHKKRHLDYYEIIFVVKGSVYLQVNNHHFTLTENDLLILPPYNTIYGYKESEQTNSFYWVRFATDQFEAFHIADCYLKIADPYKLIELFKQLLFIANSPGYPAYMPDVILTFILNILSMHHTSNIQKNHIIAKNVAEWICENVNMNTTAEEIGRIFNYNKDYLCRLFKSVMGVTLKEYINREQIKRAKNMLLTSNYTIKQISEIFGCENENLFIKFFTYHAKISPTKFRNHCTG